MGKTKRKRSLKQRTHRKQRKYVARYRKTTKRQKRRKTRKRLKGGGDSDSDSHSDSDPGPLPPPSDHPDHSLPRTFSRKISGSLSLPLNKKLYFKGTVLDRVTNKLGFSTEERVANVKFRFVNITHIEHTTETYANPRSGLRGAAVIKPPSSPLTPTANGP